MIKLERAVAMRSITYVLCLTVFVWAKADNAAAHEYQSNHEVIVQIAPDSLDLFLRVRLVQGKKASVLHVLADINKNGVLEQLERLKLSSLLLQQAIAQLEVRNVKTSKLYRFQKPDKIQLLPERGDIKKRALTAQALFRLETVKEKHIAFQLSFRCTQAKGYTLQLQALKKSCLESDKWQPRRRKQFITLMDKHTKLQLRFVPHCH